MADAQLDDSNESCKWILYSMERNYLSDLEAVKIH